MPPRLSPALSPQFIAPPTSPLAQACKEEGNRHFGAGDYETAVACYTEALRHLPAGGELDAPRAILYANRAASHLQRGDAGSALYDCDRALEFNPAYVKALGRRAVALERLEKLDEALRGECAAAAAAAAEGCVLWLCVWRGGREWARGSS